MPDRAKETDHAHDIGRLHVYFAVSSVLLVASLFWMFQQDYDRQWKVYQREFREMEKTRARKELEQMELRKQPDKAQEEMEEISRQAEAARKEFESRQEQVLALEEEISKWGGVIYKENNLKLQFTKVEYDVAKFEIEDAIHKGRTPDPGIIQHFKELTAKVAQETEVVKAYEETKTGKEMELGALKKNLMQAQRAYKAKTSSQADLIRKLSSLGYSVVGDARSGFQIRKGFEDLLYQFRNAPLVDFIGPTVKIQQTVLDNLRDDYYFAQVPKVDRCETCHLVTAKTGYEDLKQPFRTHPGAGDLYLSSASPHPVEKFGCTVCHGGMSWAVDFLRAYHTPSDSKQREEWDHWTKDQLGVSWSKHDQKEAHYWDYPMIPLKYIESSCLQCHKNPASIPEAGKLFTGYELFKQNGCFGCHKTAGFENVRKVGPSLMHVSQKLDKAWMWKWLKDPRRSLSHRKMPQVFDLTNSRGVDFEGRSLTVQNNAEIHGIVAYLLDASEKDKSYQTVAVTGEGDPQKGQNLLLSKGCLACHENKKALEKLQNSLVSSEEEEKSGQEILAELKMALPGSFPEATFAPSLSGIASKLHKEKGKPWLLDWVKNPQHYFPESTMPNFRLTDEEALHLVAFLLTDEHRDKPMDEVDVPEVDESVIDELLINKKLADRMVRAKAEKDVKDMTLEDRLIALGKNAVGHYGCSGCHRIPGFENAQGIGPELSAFGAKKVDKLDFGLLHLGEHSRYAWIEQKLRDPRSFDMEPKVDWRAKETNGHSSRPASHPMEYQSIRRISRKDRLRMPQFQFSQEQIEAIVTFVTGMTGKPIHPDYGDKLEGDRGDRVRGEMVIRKYNCQGCHRFSMDTITYEFAAADGNKRQVTFEGRFLQRYYDEDAEKPRYSFQAWIETEGPGGKISIGDPVTVLPDQVKPEMFQHGLGGDVIPHIVAERIEALKVKPAEAITYAPPPLHEEGRKVQPKWLYQFLKKPYRIRPATQVVMPTFPMTDEEATHLTHYFAVQAKRQLLEKASAALLSLGKSGDLKWLGEGEEIARQQIKRLAQGKLGYEEVKDLALEILAKAPASLGEINFESRHLLAEFAEYTYPFERIREVEPDYLAAQEAKTPEFLRKAEILMGKEDPANKQIKATDCQSCHSIGDSKPDGKETDFGPDLARVRERLRPRYLTRWLLNPSRILPGTRMTDFFQDEKAEEEYRKDNFTYQTIFPGTAAEQAQAIRDVLLNWKK